MRDACEARTDPRVSAAREADERVARNDPDGAKRVLAAVLERRVAVLREGGERPDALDFKLSVLAGDLSASLGEATAALELYHLGAAWAARSGDLRLSTLAQAKRAASAIESGALAVADDALGAIDPGLTGRAATASTLEELAQWETRSAAFGGRADPVAAHTYWVTARYLAAHGRFGPARRCLERARWHIRVAPGALETAFQQRELSVRLDLDDALYHLQCGDHAAAARLIEPYADAGLATREPVIYARVQGLRARLALVRGRLGECHRVLRAMLDQAALSGQPLTLGRSLLNLARFLILVNQSERALELLQGARTSLDARARAGLGAEFAHAKAVAEARQRTASRGGDLSLSAIYDAHDGFAFADRCLADGMVAPIAVAGGETGHDFEAAFNAEAAAFRARLLDDAAATSAERLSALSRRFGDTDSPLILGRLTVLHAMHALRARDVGLAHRALTTARELLERHPAPLDVWQCLTLLILCDQMLGHRPAAHRNTLLAEDHLRQLAGSLEPRDRETFMIDKWTAEERFLRLESDVLNALTQDFEGAFLISRPARWLAAARKVLRLLEYAGRYRTHLGAEAADAELTPTERHVSVWRQLLAHPLRQRTVHTLVLSDRTLVVSRGFLSLSWRLSAVGEGRLRALVNRWHRTSACWWDRFSRHRTFPVLFPDAPDTARSIRLLDRIARRIARELRLDELLEGIPPWVDEVVFVPDGPLHVMPLVALPCGSEYLGQQYFVTNSFGVPGRGKERGLGRKGLVVDVSEPLRDPAAPDAPPLAPLPKAAEEAKAVEAVAAGYLGADVTWVSSGGSEGAMPPFKQRVVEGLGSCTFAHLSCHGTFNPDSPYESGLVLPGPGGCWDILGVSEITALDLSGIRHLSLSACYSADSFRFPGRWVVGLPEAFWRAGVESLLGFLWPVEDAVTHALMTSYYARIARQSARRAVRALRRACLDESLADCRGLPLRHPFFWASLTAYRGASSSPARYS